MAEPTPEEWAEQETEWNAWADKELAKGKCPYSGLELTFDGDAGPDSLSCWVCDCFGFDPKDKRLGTNG